MLDGAQPGLEAGVLDLGLGQPPIELGQLGSDGVEALVSLVMAAEQAHGRERSDGARDGGGPELSGHPAASRLNAPPRGGAVW